MSKHLAVESAGTKAMERLEQTLCRVYGRRSAIQGHGRHRAEYVEADQAVAA
jgi:hypothetical protein